MLEVDWRVRVDDRIALNNMSVRAVLAVVAPVRKGNPRASWISSDTFELMKRRNKARAQWYRPHKEAKHAIMHPVVQAWNVVS